MRIILKAEHVSISYKIGDFKDIGLKEWTMRHLKGQYHVERFMAVNDVSFELYEGDMLGIIGTNGAGKSTLLKAVIGVMEPREGHIERNGSISALLELASGFDGDLTVKENAYLRGAMLGYTKAFMDETYEQILDFSELREFGDRPFKQLSTGMQSRLAFSIASLVQPEILILDEVLSVGDGAFQEKSAAKMREIISGGAATILVSHSLAQVRELCNKVLWLHKGQQVAFGEAEPLCDLYGAFLNGHFQIGDIVHSIDVFQERRFAQQTPEKWKDERHNGTGRAVIKKVVVLDQNGSAAATVRTGEQFSIRFEYEFLEEVYKPYCGVAIFKADGTHCYGTNTKLDGVSWDPEKTGTVQFQVDRCPLVQGAYILDVAISEEGKPDCDYFRSALSFKVVCSQTDTKSASFSHRWKLDKMEIKID